ncbi:GD17972 [Drosophila simulans]|uniref:GD17972 n=1 Tax=Drosophila simulans TaxID=7240 RepID=B4R417_DROSI|nr:GD17972 [Drosophila simulans]
MLLLLLTHFKPTSRQMQLLAKCRSARLRRVFPSRRPCLELFGPPGPIGPSIVVAGKVKTMANNFYNVSGCGVEEK